MKVTKNFLQFFTEKPPSFLRDDNCKFRVEGKIYDYSDLSSMQKLFSADMVLKYTLNEWYALPDPDKLEYLKNFIEGTFRQDRAAREAKVKKLDELMKESDLKLPELDYILSNIQPCRLVGDMKREAGFRFLDKETKEVTDFDYHSIWCVLANNIDEKTAKRFMQNVVYVKLDYKPHEERTISEIPGEHHTYLVNQYRPPEWKAVKDVTPHLDEHFAGLFTHLFPDPDCREFVYNWVYHSLTARAGTYLYLCGGQGSGKNTLAALLQNLHGHHNSSSPKQGAIKKQFNYFLKNRRFVFFDEYNARGREDKDLLKSIINDRIQVEGKHRDHEDIEVHASYMIANNSLNAIGLEPIDRRFSVPDITDTDLIKGTGREFVRDLVAKIRDPKVIAAFAAHILETYEKPKYFFDEPYQKTRFEEVVLSTTRAGISDMIAKIRDKEQDKYYYQDELETHQRLKRAFRYPNIYDWMHFFKSVKYGGEPLGEVKGEVFIPRPDFQPETSSRGDLV